MREKYRVEDLRAETREQGRAKEVTRGSEGSRMWRGVQRGLGEPSRVI